MSTPILLAIFAHPDDETFRPGGTLALLARQGVNVYLLTLTHGEAGCCGEPAFCTPDDLPAVRQRELQKACAILGIQPPILWEYPDGHLAEMEPERMIAEIRGVIRQLQPQVLLSFGADGLSGHPDHIAVGKWASEAFSRQQDIAALYHMAVPQSLALQLGMSQLHPVPDDEISLAIDVSSVWEAKLAAIYSHATQTGSSPMLKASLERQRLFFGVEHFVRAALRHPDDDFLPQALKDYIQ